MTKPQCQASLQRMWNVRAAAKGLFALSLMAIAPPVHAQTWANGRQRPSLREIATVDHTGERSWLWGQEDVAQNGLEQFPAEEQAIDARSVYLRVDAGRLWWRTYVSAETAPQNNLTAYLFIDADLNPATGLSAAATAIDPALTSDPSGGGFEYVLSVRGDGTQVRLWAPDAMQTAFVSSTAAAIQLDSEAGLFFDPLRVGAREHGYVQASVVDSLVGISGGCHARFYVRTTNQTQALGAGDLDVGVAVECVPTDADANSVPDVIEPAQYGCVSDDQCPAGGICRDRRCWLAPVCTDDADCGANATCVEGSCIVATGDRCDNDRDCTSGICSNGRCVACTSDSACGAGRVCGPDGRCVTGETAGTGVGGTGSGTAADGGIVLAEGERIQGGACACRLGRDARSAGSAAWLLLVASLGSSQLRRRREQESQR